MPVATDTPVSYIQGIGPASADALKVVGVQTVFDLLRFPPAVLHVAVGSRASLGEVLAWRAMAVLLQIDRLTPQWAELLVKKGIGTLGELSRQPLLDLLRLFDEAQAAGAVQNVPGLSDAGAILTEATRLHHTGAFSGRLVDADGIPREGTAVHLGHLAARCDARGRFRLLRIPIDWTGPLICQLDETRTYAFEGLSIARDATTGEEIELRLPQTWGAMPSAPVPSASELDGDVLPRLAGHRLRTVGKEPDELRDGDLLVVDYLYESEPDARLASRLRVLVQGEIHVYTYRVPLASLPSPVRLHDCFRVTNGTFVPFPGTPAAVAAYRASRRARRQFPAPAAAATRAEKQARFEAIVQFVRETVVGD